MYFLAVRIDESMELFAKQSKIDLFEQVYGYYFKNNRLSLTVDQYDAFIQWWFDSDRFTESGEYAVIQLSEVFEIKMLKIKEEDL